MRYRVRDLAYAAGFFDAEGCVVTSRHRRYFGQQLLLSAVIANTDQHVLLWLQSLFGGNIVHCPAKARKQEHWRWSVWCNQASRFLHAIIPYLLLKRNAADWGIRLQLATKEKQKLLAFNRVRSANARKGHASLSSFLSRYSGRRVAALAYAAGFYDGEGNCYLATSRRGYKDTNLQIGNTEKSVLLWLQQQFGGSIRERSNDPSFLGRKNRFWTLTVKSRQARRMVGRLQPYLQVKAA